MTFSDALLLPRICHEGEPLPAGKGILKHNEEQLFRPIVKRAVQPTLRKVANLETARPRYDPRATARAASAGTYKLFDNLLKRRLTNKVFNVFQSEQTNFNIRLFEYIASGCATAASPEGEEREHGTKRPRALRALPMRFLRSGRFLRRMESLAHFDLPKMLSNS